MDIIIKNLQEIPQNQREDFEALIKTSLSNDGQDNELKSILINFLNQDQSIDASEIYGLDNFSDFRNKYEIQQSNENESEDLLSEFSSNTHLHESISEANLDSDLYSEFGLPSPKMEGTDGVDSPFSGEIVAKEQVPFVDIPLPDIQFDQTDKIEFGEPDTEQDNTSEISSNNDNNDSEKDKEKTLDQSPAELAAAMTVLDQVLSITDRIHRRNDHHPSGAVSSSSEQTHGHAEAPRADIGSALTSLAASGINLTTAGVNTTTSVLGALNKGINGGINLATSSYNATASAIKSIDKDKIGFAIENSMKMLRGKGGLLNAKARSELTGMPSESNVIDLRERLAKAMASKDRGSVERDIALISDKKLAGKRNALVSIMKGIEDGYPNGRLSSLEITKGITAGAAINSAINGSEHEKAMAKAILSNNGNIPDAANELDFVANEYQRLHDTLESLNKHALDKGWTQEEIKNQFAAPVQEWLDKRKVEDEMLKNLSEIQHESAVPEISQEESESRKRKMDEMIEQLMKMIAKLMGSNQDQEQGQKIAPSITRNR